MPPCELFRDNDDDCTELATTTRDDSSGYLPARRYCESCAKRYDDWLDNYDPSDADLSRMYDAPSMAEQMDEAYRLKRALK